MAGPSFVMFSKAAASYVAIMNHATQDSGQRIVALAQVLLSAVYQNGQEWSDQEKANFLAVIMDTVFDQMPELEYEFGVSLKQLQDDKDA